LLSTQYKEHNSDYRQWDQRSHAQDYVLFADNVGPSLAIDETALSCGELYTIVTNKAGHTGHGTLVAMVKGTKSEDVIAVLNKIAVCQRERVKELTLDLSPTMMRIARAVFPNALLTNDRFHVQRLFYEAIDELRISYRWMARDLENEQMERCKKQGVDYVPSRYSNGDTPKQLLARAKFVLTKHRSKWTQTQAERARILFQIHPELEQAYDLAMELTSIYNYRCEKNVARTKLALWYNKVEKLGKGCFRTVLDTLKNHYETILNYFVHRQTNAFAESFNAKVKAFRTQFRGVRDIPFFIFRLSKLCA
jgi:transposase